MITHDNKIITKLRIGTHLYQTKLKHMITKIKHMITKNAKIIIGNYLYQTK